MGIIAVVFFLDKEYIATSYLYGDAGQLEVPK